MTKNIKRASRTTAAASLMALALTGAGHAQAQAQPAGQLFLGGGLGVANQALQCAANAPCETTRAGIKLMGGMHINADWSAELSYLRPASAFTASSTNGVQTWSGSYRVQALGASAGYRFEAGGLQWQARAGVARVQARFDSVTAGVPGSNSASFQPLLGVGLRYALSPGLALRVDADLTRSKTYAAAGRFSLLTAALEQSF